MTKEKLLQFIEKFYEINASFEDKVGDILGQYTRTKDENVLAENLTFNLCSEYYQKLSDLCIEIIKELKTELIAQTTTESDDEE